MFNLAHKRDVNYNYIETLFPTYWEKKKKHKFEKGNGKVARK